MFVTADYESALPELVELVQIHAHCPRVVGCSAGGAPNTIYFANYNPAKGFRFTFTAGFPTGVSISAQVKYGPGLTEWLLIKSIYRKR